MKSFTPYAVIIHPWSRSVLGRGPKERLCDCNCFIMPTHKMGGLRFHRKTSLQVTFPDLGSVAGSSAEICDIWVSKIANTVGGYAAWWLVLDGAKTFGQCVLSLFAEQWVSRFLTSIAGCDRKRALRNTKPSAFIFLTHFGQREVSYLDVLRTAEKSFDSCFASSSDGTIYPTESVVYFLN